MLATVLTVVLPVCLAGVGAWLVYERNAARAIPGAAGYRTFGGPHGKLLAVGEPWGQACQPVRFTVEEHAPDAVYAQVVAVVAEARHDGLDVTLETRNFYWVPSSVYYPAGRTPASVPRVGIFTKDGTPPRLSNHKPESIGLGWDAALDPDGQHEHMTDAQGDLYLQALAGNPQAVRRSIRQLIALTQGVISTTRHDSGIARDTGVDRFSAADIAAMKLMSGCGDAPLATVSAAG